MNFAIAVLTALWQMLGVTAKLRTLLSQWRVTRAKEGAVAAAPSDKAELVKYLDEGKL